MRAGVFFETTMTEPVPRRRLLQWLAAGTALALAGCGRKARPLAPLDADPRAPRRYPVDKSLPPEIRNLPPEMVPPPEPPQGPNQGPLYPAPNVESPYWSPNSIYQP